PIPDKPCLPLHSDKGEFCKQLHRASRGLRLASISAGASLGPPNGRGRFPRRGANARPLPLRCSFRTARVRFASLPDQGTLICGDSVAEWHFMRRLCRYFWRRMPLGLVRRRPLSPRLRVVQLEGRCVPSAFFTQTNLVSNTSGQAPVTDPNLTNPWGIDVN